MKLSWRYGVLAGIVLALFSLYPQAKLMYIRGTEWNGHFAYIDVDEAAYAAYLSALIDGRPRRNDPYTGRDDDDGSRPESIFSIQFASPYVIALPARFLGVKADRAMVIAGAAAAFAAGLAIFWLTALITKDSLFSFAATLSTVAFGSLAAGEGALREILFGEIAYPFFPAYRRYVPAVAFPVFFAFCGFVWRLALNDPTSVADQDGVQSPRRKQVHVLCIAGSALCFAWLLFSYFYLWTTAAAVLFSVVAVTLIVRPAGWVESSVRTATAACCCVLLFVPYGMFLSHRADTVDAYQMLALSHAPDLFRAPEIVAILAAAVLILGVAMGRVVLKDAKAVFVLSLIATVLIVFNQQVVTGRSLQPIHFQVFAANYVAVFALLLAVHMFLTAPAAQDRPVRRLMPLALAGAAIVWGGVECELNTRPLDDTNYRLDAAMSVLAKLRDAAAADPELKDATVLAYDLPLADKLPVEAPQNVLWSRHQAVFSSLAPDESERRYFCYLYYLNVDGVRLRHLLKTDFVTITALFGWDRHTDRLSVDARPLTDYEIQAKVAEYERFRYTFDGGDASDPRLSFVIVPDGYDLDLSALTRWYELSKIANAGGNTLYRARYLDTEVEAPRGN